MPCQNERQIIIAISKLVSGNFLAAILSFPTKQSFSGEHSCHITLFVLNDRLPSHWEPNVCLSWIHQQTPEVFYHHKNTLYRIYQPLRAASIKQQVRSHHISHESYFITSYLQKILTNCQRAINDITMPTLRTLLGRVTLWGRPKLYGARSSLKVLSKVFLEADRYVMLKRAWWRRQQGRHNKQLDASLVLGSKLSKGLEQLPAEIDGCLETYTEETKLLTFGFLFLSFCMFPSLPEYCFWKMSKLRARKPIFQNNVISGDFDSEKLRLSLC